MKKNLLSIFCLISLMAIMQSCSKDESTSSTTVSDQTIARMAMSSDDMVYMPSTARATQNSNTFRIKMNSIAAKSFNAGERSNFPMNSMLVREALDQNGNVTGYDIMYRTESDPHSSRGWVWTRANDNGEVIISSNEKGATCKSCHSGQVASLTGL